MARRRRRATGYPTLSGSVGSGGSGPDTVGGFENQEELGGFGPGGNKGGAMPAINIYNSAIAQAAAEQGGGGIGQTTTTSQGGRQHHHHAPAHHHR